MCVGHRGERMKTYAKTMMLKESDQNKVHKMGNSINLATKQPTLKCLSHNQQWINIINYVAKCYKFQLMLPAQHTYG